MKIPSPKLNRLLAIAIAFSISMVLFIGAGIYLNRQNNIYLAVAGPMTEDNLSGLEMIQGVQLYLDQVNATGGVAGKKIKLLRFDDRNDVQTAKKKALEIIASPALAVLGHLYSSTSVAAGKIYQSEEMPAITGSATANNVTSANDWYFRVIFNNRFQAAFIADYAEKVLDYSRASIVFSNDNYGQTLKESFSSTFKNLGGEIVQEWTISATDKNFVKQQQQIVKDLTNSNQDSQEVIFFATHNEDVVDLIAQINRRGLKYPLIGADSLGGIAFAQKFNLLAEEQARPGNFSNGIYAVSPIVFDIASEQAQQFRNQYIQKYRSSPGWTAATYYDAAKLAVEAVQRAELTGDKLNLAQERQQVKNALARINRADNGVEGVTGNLYFDTEGDVNNAIYIGTFEQQKFISAFTQLQPVNNLDVYNKLQQEIDSGKILLVDDKPMHRTNIVYTGIDINEIRNLDEKTSSYLVDFYLWFRYRGNINGDKIEFTNYGTDRMDSGDKLELDEPISEHITDGVTYRVYRVKADFKEKFRFNNYPFDRQELAVRFRHENLTRDNLIYVVDAVGMGQTTAKEVIANWERSKVFETISDWQVTTVDFFSSILTNDSTLGNPKLFGSKIDLQYSRFNTVIRIKRDTVSFAIKNLLPLVFFIGVSYLLLFLPFEQISIEAVSGTLLAIVFFHLSLLEGLPEGIGYVVALDYGFYVIYGLIGLELLLVVIGNKPEIRKDQIAIKRLILTSRIIFPVILLISVVVLAIQYEVFT